MDNCEEMNNSMDLVSEIDGCDLPIKNTEYLSEYINEINKDNISDIQYDKSKFEKGISKMSKICGMITALVNVGITPDNALAYISEYELNEKGTEATLEITKIQADASIAASRCGLEASQKNMI